MDSQANYHAIGKVISPIMSNIVNPAIELLMLAAIVVFVWGVVQMIMNSEESEGRAAGQRHMLWGIVGLFIMVSAYGIVRLIASTFNVQLPFL